MTAPTKHQLAIARSITGAKPGTPVPGGAPLTLTRGTITSIPSSGGYAMVSIGGASPSVPCDVLTSTPLSVGLTVEILTATPRALIIGVLLSGGRLPFDFVQRNASYTLGTSSNTILPFDTVVQDEETTSDFSTSSSRFTCPVPGRYSVKSVLVAGLGSGTILSFAVFKNGSQWALLDYFTAPASGNYAVKGSAEVPCAAGDLLDIRYTCSVSSTLFTGGDAWASFGWRWPL